MIECAIINDLLPLYVDDVLSRESRALVDEHLNQCEKCNRELLKMQNSEISVSIHDKDRAQIGVLKAMKKKLFRKSVIISLGSIAVVFALALVILKWVLLPQTSIPYEEGMIEAQVGTVTVAYDENGNPIVMTEPISTYANTHERQVLDIISSRKTAMRSVGYINIEENGESIRLVFINYTENLLSKLEPGGETAYSSRIIEPYDNIVLSEDGQTVVWKAFDKIEVYYVNQKLIGINLQNDYSKLRSSGTLIWSGTLDS